MTEETGASSFLFSLLPICWRRLPPPGAGQFPQLWRLSGSAPCPWDTTRETALGTALDKWQLRALFCQSRQALAAKPGKCGRVPSPGVPFPVTNKERAVSFWNQQLSFFFFFAGDWLSLVISVLWNLKRIAVSVRRAWHTGRLFKKQIWPVSEMAQQVRRLLHKFRDLSSIHRPCKDGGRTGPKDPPALASQMLGLKE